MDCWDINGMESDGFMAGEEVEFESTVGRAQHARETVL